MYIIYCYNLWVIHKYCNFCGDRWPKCAVDSVTVLSSTFSQRPNKSLWVMSSADLNSCVFRFLLYESVWITPLFSLGISLLAALVSLEQLVKSFTELRSDGQFLSSFPLSLFHQFIPSVHLPFLYHFISSPPPFPFYFLSSSLQVTSSRVAQQQQQQQTGAGSGKASPLLFFFLLLFFLLYVSLHGAAFSLWRISLT